jgi:DNA (cytosine-5)-methyltransferase 1
VIRYGSVCSGIEAATVAWHPLGWEPAWFSEIEPFPCAVLAHHYPTVQNLGDILAITEDDLARLGPIDLLVGGTPCQSFSVAGLRGGLADPRGNLALRFCQLAGVVRPRWLVWENVPGVLSSGAGEDFGSIIRGLEELGYGVAWRSLDAQYFGVAQRRERVFAVGYFGDWRPAAAVLLEPSSVCGNPPPSRAAGKDVACSVIKGAAIGRKPEAGPQYGDSLTDGSCCTLCRNEVHAVAGTLQANYADKWGLDNQHVDAGCPMFVTHAVDLQNCALGGSIAGTLDTTRPSRGGGQAVITHALTSKSFDASEDGTGRSTPLVPVALQEDNQNGVCMRDTTGSLRSNAPGSQPCGTLVFAHAVRRLTPTECERLQGFPDSYTQVPYRGKPAADGPRYAALGNSMAVPVMHWIGRRIDKLERLTNQEAT